jgi:hypothetical protein
VLEPVIGVSHPVGLEVFGRRYFIVIGVDTNHSSAKLLAGGLASAPLIWRHAISIFPPP